MGRFNIVHKSMASPLYAWISIQQVRTRAEQLLRHNAMLSPASGACDMGLVMRVSPGASLRTGRALAMGTALVSCSFSFQRRRSSETCKT